MIVPTAISSTKFMISFIFIPYAYFRSAFKTGDNLLFHNHLEVFLLTRRFVMRWIKIFVDWILYP